MVEVVVVVVSELVVLNVVVVVEVLEVVVLDVVVVLELVVLEVVELEVVVTASVPLITMEESVSCVLFDPVHIVASGTPPNWNNSARLCPGISAGWMELLIGTFTAVFVGVPQDVPLTETSMKPPETARTVGGEVLLSINFGRSLYGVFVLPQHTNKFKSTEVMFTSVPMLKGAAVQKVFQTDAVPFKAAEFAEGELESKLPTTG